MTKTTTASRPLAKVSIKDSIKILKHVRNKPVKKAKDFLNGLISEKNDINKKHYTGASKEILKLIEEAESNAESLGLDTEKMLVKEAVANESFSYMLPKSRYSHRGRRAKLCQLKVTLVEG
jgi:ribosomal protein L22